MLSLLFPLVRFACLIQPDADGKLWSLGRWLLYVIHFLDYSATLGEGTATPEFLTNIAATFHLAAHHWRTALRTFGRLWLRDCLSLLKNFILEDSNGLDRRRRLN